MLCTVMCVHPATCTAVVTVWSKYPSPPPVASQVFARVLNSESQDLITHADVWMTQGLLDSLCACTIGSWLLSVALPAQGKASNVHQEPGIFAWHPCQPALVSRTLVISSNPVTLALSHVISS